MKSSFREFSFLRKECGLFYAMFFIWHKIALKLSGSGISARWRKNKDRWLEKIFSALTIYNNKTSSVNNRRFIRIDAGFRVPLYLRPYTSDKDVFSQVLINEDYKSVSDIFGQYFKQPAGNIIDCGSNIGLTSVYFSKCYPKARFLAVEPIKDNVEVLKLNFDAAGLADYEIIEGGVWNENRMLAVNNQFRDGKEWSFNLRESDAADGGIPSYSLKDIIGRFESPIDILKIDVEGTEKVLFSDKSYAMDFLRKVKCMAIEIHDEFDCRAQIYEILNAANFFYYDIRDMTIAINRTYA